MGTQFDNVTFNQWQQAAEAALRGKSFDTLTKYSADNIGVSPLYQSGTKSNQAALPNGEWQINQAINHPDIEQSKTQISKDLEQGVNALSLYSNQSLNALGYGLNLNQVNIKNLFENTYLDMISLRLEAGLDEISLAENILNHSNNHAQLSLGVDPVGKLAQFGGWDSESIAKTSVQNAFNQYNATHILRLDGRIAHNAGASEAQELSYILGCALTYLKWADEANLDLNIIAPKLEICLSVDQNQFINIAKIRAMRQLWAELLAGLDIEQCPAYIFAETSLRMTTKRDPMVNILRTTTACFAAGVGGANQIGILPFSAAIGLAPDFDRRLARHTQTILIEESHLADVTDPSAGSGYIEQLTQDLTKIAWDGFQATQHSGGLIQGLTSGDIQNQIKISAQNRKPQIIGTTIFINENEKPYQPQQVDRFTPNIPQFSTPIQSLAPVRDAEIHETTQKGAN